MIKPTIYLCLLSFFLLQSCSTPPPSAVSDPRVRVTAPFKWDVSVIGIRERAKGVGGLEAQIELFNKDDEMQKIEYKFWWFDQAGFKLDSVMTQWRGKSISGNGHYSLNAVGPNARAKYFLLHVRDKHNGEIVVAVDSRLKGKE